MAPRKYWTSEDLSRLKSFILSQKQVLTPIFYQNILAGSIKNRKPSGFFKKMKEYLNRSTEQCKSKFQKFEKEIYTKYLQIPRKDFQVFLWIQKNKDVNKKISKYSEIAKNQVREESKLTIKSNLHHLNQIKENLSRSADESKSESDDNQNENSSSCSQYYNEDISSSESQTEEDLIRHWIKIRDKMKDNEKSGSIQSNIEFKLEFKLLSCLWFI